MIILGIDPGYERCGVAVLEKTNDGKEKLLFSDCIKTPATMEFPERLYILCRNFEKVIKKWQPEILSIEKIFFTTNQKTATRVSEVRGALIYISKNNNLQIMEPTPLEIKMALTGYGKAEKGQVQEMVKAVLKLDKMPKYDDEVDAIAAALTCSAISRSIYK